MAHGTDSDHADWVDSWTDVNGERHMGNYDPSEYAEVDFLTLKLPLDNLEPGDEGYRSIAVFFTDEYDLDDVYEDIEDSYGISGE